MAKKASQDESVYFNDGCVKESSYVFIASKLHSVNPDEYDFSRLYFHKIPGWGRQDLNRNVVSVCYLANPNSFQALSEDGEVTSYDPQGSTSASIADVEKYGAVSQIRTIEGVLYVCGMQGQVYRRGSSGWVHIDKGILDPKVSARALHLNSIDGTSGKDIYVVGFGGRILHYNGKTWTELPSPTNLHLERVHCVAPGETYVCGNNGTFLKITPQGIENHSIELEDHFWGLTSFQGKVYLATLEGLYVFDGSTVEEVDTGLEPAIGGYRLDARDGQLWSFGVDDLAFFDGKSWTRVIHPDNV
jgi:hypothetical protein